MDVSGAVGACAQAISLALQAMEADPRSSKVRGEEEKEEEEETNPRRSVCFDGGTRVSFPHYS